MADWAAGYVTEVTYTQGYYRELSPLALRFALHCAGYTAPPARDFSYCELGFGQGISLNFHAAAHPDARFFGADINPAHVAGAQALAQASGANLTLTDAGFAELLARDDIPDFDYIGIHGVWSWISGDNQAALVAFIRRHLKPGGALYISYNCLPGWSTGMPLRHLLVEHAERVAGGDGGVISQIEEALTFTKKLADTGLGYFANPAVKEKLEGIARQNRNYLAHEYMNRDWRVMHFAEVAEALAEAKLSFAASASTLEQLDGVRIPKAGLDVLATVKDPIQRQTVRDYLLNQQFRRDIFVRGATRLTGAEQRRLLDATVFALNRPVAALQKPEGEGGNRRGVPAPVHDALVTVLATGCKSLAELVAACPDVALPVLRQSLMLLVGAGDLTVAHDAEGVAAAAGPVGRLNAIIAARAGEGNEVPYLCSPLSGGGLSLTAFQQLMVSVLNDPAAPDPERMAKAAWARLSAIGQRVVSGGKACESEEDNLATLRRIATDFVAQELPLLRTLGVVGG